MKFIFIHIPKTAGTSFRLSLAAKMSSFWDYGAKNLDTSDEIKLTVYSNAPEKLVEISKQNEVGFISGHFPALKYKRFFPEAKLLTFVREPIDRVISEYNHHVRLGGYTQSISAFCNIPVHKNRQFGFFSGLSVDDFYFVGLTERYSHSLDLFNDMTGLKLKERKMNFAKNQARKPLEISRGDLDKKTIQLIERENAEDMKLYTAIKEKFLAAHKA